MMINGLNDCKTFNPLVERSNRSRPTILLKGFKRLGPFFSPIEKYQARTGRVIKHYLLKLPHPPKRQPSLYT